MLKNPFYVYGPKCCDVPSNLNFGAYMLNRLWAHKDKVAMINGATDEKITYKEITQQAMNFAISLTRMGVRKGDIVALYSENNQEFWSALIGVVCTGAVVTTISTAYAKGEIQHAMSISKPKYIICSQEMYKNNKKTLKSLEHIKKIILFGNEKQYNTLFYKDMALADNGYINNVNFDDFLSVDAGGDDTLFIVYSSGTTGLPKGVMLSHLNVLTSCTLFSFRGTVQGPKICNFLATPGKHVQGNERPSSLNPNYISLNITPWYHVMGLVGTLGAFTFGRTGVYLAKFEVDLYLKTIEKYKVAILSVVPPVLVAVCKAQSTYDLSSVTGVYSGAAPLHKDTISAVYDKFPNVRTVFQGYGSSETTLAVIRYNHDDLVSNKTGSVGRVVAGTVIKVVDIETRKPLGPNKPGEICAKGGLLMKGYLGKERKEELDNEGFYKTGDVGYYDEDGFFYISDRLKELIKYKGHQVPPAELEAALLQHDAIKDAGVVGIPHKESGEVPLAFVVVQPGQTVTEQDIKDFIAERLSKPKHLRGGVRFIEQIPKSASGKILRTELRKLAKSQKSKL